MLLECQFDQNEKLKSSVNKGFDAEDLRMQPIGRDLDGFIYWYHEVSETYSVNFISEANYTLGIFSHFRLAKVGLHSRCKKNKMDARKKCSAQGRHLSSFPLFFI